MSINKDLINNNVDSKNQVKYNQHFFGDYKNKNSFKVMFIGNSITLHEKKPQIGWNFKHGMAASKSSKDYVHIVQRQIENKLHSKIGCLVYNAADFERDYSNPLMLDKIFYQAEKFNPDLTIVRLGENIYKDNLDEKNVEKAFDKLIFNLKNISKNVIITSLFWHHDKLDEIIKKISEKYNTKYVFLYDLGEDDANKAIGLFEHPGIQGHPGDLGMKKIASRIFEAISSII